MRLPLLLLVGQPILVAAQWSAESLTTFICAFLLFFCCMGLLAGHYGMKYGPCAERELPGEQEIKAANAMGEHRVDEMTHLSAEERLIVMANNKELKTDSQGDYERQMQKKKEKRLRKEGRLKGNVEPGSGMKDPSKMHKAGIEQIQKAPEANESDYTTPRSPYSGNKKQMHQGKQRKLNVSEVLQRTGQSPGSGGSGRKNKVMPMKSQ